MGSLRGTMRRREYEKIKRQRAMEVSLLRFVYENSADEENQATNQRGVRNSKSKEWTRTIRT